MKKTMISALLAIVAATPALAQDTWRIGNIAATSGVLKGPGEPSTVAIDIAVAEINAAGGINGKPVEIVRFDTGSDPRQASVGMRRLAQDEDVIAVLGPFSSGEANVALNDAERLGVLTIPTSASAPGLTDGKRYGWRLTEDERKQFSRLLTTLKDEGIALDTVEIVYISDDTVSNTAGTKVYPELLAEAGIAFGDPIPVQYKSFDMSAQAARILSTNPDAVAIAATPDSASKIARELRRQGYQGRLIGSQIFADPNIVELFGPAAEGTFVVAGFWRENNEAAMRFNEAYLRETEARGLHRLGAHHSDAQAYDGVYLVKQLIEASGVTGDPDKLAEERDALVDAMQGVRFTGVLGTDICWSGNDAELPGQVIEVKDGAWTRFAEVPADPC